MISLEVIHTDVMNMKKSRRHANDRTFSSRIFLVDYIAHTLHYLMANIIYISDTLLKFFFSNFHHTTLEQEGSVTTE
jgi:hypothetical protein